MLNLSFVAKHKVTHSVPSDVLQIVLLHLPQSYTNIMQVNCFKINVYSFVQSGLLVNVVIAILKGVSARQTPAIVHRLRGKCHSLLNSQQCKTLVYKDIAGYFMFEGKWCIRLLLGSNFFGCMCVCHHKMASFWQRLWLLAPLSQVSWRTGV